jgi:hypothetical protein
MNKDDNYKVDRYGRPTKIVRDGGRVVTKMMAMDHKAPNSLDAVLNRELGVQPRWPVVDAAAHRPRFITPATLRTADSARDAAIVDAGRAAKQAAHLAYLQDKLTAWRPDQEAVLKQLADARPRTALEQFLNPDRDDEDEDNKNGEDRDDDEDDEEENGKRGRRRDARPKRKEWEEEKEHDPGHDDDWKDARPCQHCGGSGVEPGHEGDDEALRHFQTNEAVRATKTNTESTVRRDVPDAKTTKQMSDAHHARMEADRRLRDQKLSTAWRDGSG